MNDVGFVLVKIFNDDVHDTILSTIKGVEKNNPYNQTVVFNSYCDKSNVYNLPILHLSQSQFSMEHSLYLIYPVLYLLVNFLI